MKPGGNVQVNWRQEQRTLTLEGEPVLAYTISRPEITGAGPGGRWINRYYVRLARSWKRRWEQEIYWNACLALGEQRQAARPFTLWTSELTGEVVLCARGILSLRFNGWEIRGDGRPNRVRWGDVWKVREGAPCPLRALLGKNRGWKKRLWKQVLDQGEQRRRAGDCFLERDWWKKVRAARMLEDYCLTEDGIELSIPQGMAAPMAEGCPVFIVSPEEQDIQPGQ